MLVERRNSAASGSLRFRALAKWGIDQFLRRVSGRHLLLVHAKRALDGVDDRAAGATVLVLVLAAAHLVGEVLAVRLVLVWLGATCGLVTNVGDTLLELLLSALARLGSDGLLCLYNNKLR